MFDGPLLCFILVSYYSSSAVAEGLVQNSCSVFCCLHLDGFLYFYVFFELRRTIYIFVLLFNTIDLVKIEWAFGRFGSVD